MRLSHRFAVPRKNSLASYRIRAYFSQVKRAIPDLLVSTVGLILDPHQANEIIASGKADLVMLAREFLRDPNFVLRAARDLGVDVQWPNQYHRAKDAFYKHP